MNRAIELQDPKLKRERMFKVQILGLARMAPLLKLENFNRLRDPYEFAVSEAGLVAGKLAKDQKRMADLEKLGKEQNPLRKYFRQPKVYLNLPSRGIFYPPGAIFEESTLLQCSENIF